MIAGTGGRTMGGGTLINGGAGGVWESSGTITLAPAASGFLINNSTFDIQGGGGSISRDQSNPAGATLVFTNNGLLKKTVSAGDFSLGFGVSLNNNAQTVVDTGRLNLSGGGTSAAGSSFTVASGARVLFNGDVYSLAGGTVLQGAGIFELAGGTLNLAGTVTAPVGQGHLEITGAGGFGGGILTGTGSLAVETIRWLGGPARVNGGTSTARTGLVIAGTDGHTMGRR